ncbi:MAG: electron transfer flavoprotein subunit alpha/FixB family protein, partial [Haloarcula sp.]
MPEIDPTEHEIAEIGPKIKDVDDADELRAMLELEEAGEDRAPVKTLIEDRIDKVESEDDGEMDPDAVDLSDLTVADVANMVRDIDDADVLRDLLEREEAGQDRKTAKSQIESRIESVEGTDEEDSEETEYVPPEEKYPELDHPTNDKQWVEGTVGAEYRDMWVYCETQAGELVDVSKEMLGKARELMDTYNEDYD